MAEPDIPDGMRGRQPMVRYLRDGPSGETDERRGFFRRQFLYLLEFGSSLMFAAERTQQPAQTVMSVRLGSIDADRVLKMTDGLVRIVACREEDAQVQVCESRVRIDQQRAPKVRFRRLVPIGTHFRVTEIGQGLRMLRLARQFRFKLAASVPVAPLLPI